MEHQWTVDPASEGQRLDLFLAAQLPQLTRSQIAKRLKRGNGRVNQAIASVHQFLHHGELVSFEDTDSTVVSDAPIPFLDILAETEDWIVVHKPAGVATHPDTTHQTGTLVDALLEHVPAMARVGENPQRPGIVHRLDKDVSGLLVAAKTQFGLESLKAQFAQHQVEKRYLALVHGEIRETTGDLKFKIARASDGSRMAARPVDDPDGKPAWTHYRVLRRFRGASLVELRILSGRTHQIRAHMLAFGHPIIGDTLYPAKHPDRRLIGMPLLLQSIHLAFQDPRTNHTQTFDLAPNPLFHTALTHLGPPIDAAPIFVLMGPSGSGKTTLANHWIAHSKFPLQRIISYTTRNPRPGEQSSVEYHFVDTKTFAKLEADPGFWDQTTAFGNRYGLLTTDVESALRKGPLVLTLEIEGIRALRQRGLPIYTLFLDCSRELLEQRLAARGMKSEDFERRMRQLDADLQLKPESDALIPSNDPNPLAAVRHAEAVARRFLLA